jgi:ATP-dependent Lon protease
MSLGGIREEAEIRGQRRTYIGAMPGRIIAAMRQAGSINPVLLFDEIDKLASDYKGDPAAAMLEVLDGAQNFAFKDHFLELPYDLSHAMLLTTAKMSRISPSRCWTALEVIHVQSYLAEEKCRSPNCTCCPAVCRARPEKKQPENYGRELAFIISGYTREAGVRETGAYAAAVCR